MNLFMDPWTFIFMGVLGAVGLIQYLKGWLPKAPSWVWRIVLPIVCTGIARLKGGPLGEMVIYGLLILTFAELGYETLVQGLNGLLKSLLEKVKTSLGGS